MEKGSRSLCHNRTTSYLEEGTSSVANAVPTAHQATAPDHESAPLVEVPPLAVRQGTLGPSPLQGSLLVTTENV